jgi:hypothetical protein
MNTHNRTRTGSKLTECKRHISCVIPSECPCCRVKQTWVLAVLTWNKSRICDGRLKCSLHNQSVLHYHSWGVRKGRNTSEIFCNILHWSNSDNILVEAITRSTILCAMIEEFISKCFWRWCCMTEIYFLDFIHRPYVFQPLRFEGWLFPRNVVVEKQT